MAGLIVGPPQNASATWFGTEGCVPEFWALSSDPRIAGLKDINLNDAILDITGLDLGAPIDLTIGEAVKLKGKDNELFKQAAAGVFNYFYGDPTDPNPPDYIVYIDPSIFTSYIQQALDGDREGKKALKEANKLGCPLACPQVENCKGITELVVEYNGADILDIQVFDKKDNLLNSMVSGNTITVTNNGEKLGTETIFKNAANEIVGKIHTSCSKDLNDPEFSSDGDITVLEFTEKIELKDAKFCECKGVSRLVLSIPDDLSVSSVTDKKGKPIPWSEDEDLDLVTITPIDGKDKLPSSTIITLDNDEVIDIHTSCSKPIEPNDVHGSLIIESVDKIRKNFL